MSDKKLPVAAFDLDGTIADTAADLIATLNVVLAEENLSPLPLAGAQGLIGAGAKALINRGFAQHGVTIEEPRIEELFQKFLKHYGENLCVETTLYPGVPEALDLLQNAGIELAVCTNKYEDHSIRLLEILGIVNRFKVICGRDTFPFHKPDPRHLTETVLLAGGDPRYAVMIGDSNTDISTARSAGIPVIGVPFGYTDTPIADLKPDLVVEHFNAMPAAIRKLLMR